MRLVRLFLVVIFLSPTHAEEPNEEMKVEVLYKPRVCLKKSQFNNMLKVQFKVFFENGTLFHSSYDTDVMMDIPLGLGHPSGELERGFKDMCIGERRLLTVPHHGQGDMDLPLHNGDVLPPNIPLLYEVELIDLEDKINVKEGFENIDSDGDDHITLDEIMEQFKTIQKEGGDMALSPEILLQVYNNLITAADKDNDGKISREEYRYILPHELRDEL
ncbi:peptidyl-prolyl cis-trans isomerase FKBP9-like [Saccostrea echinata]|uniref:peptidyl-prolyl cis-trans isomerase FKBP9-like n=1 Tax=Saccostrea echinata TaxID=191078 RepID=UPI002A7FE7F9|nr:peptidyl-prolyl cis-trans isomerase FKBP9-like [Saccostrea echinata]